MYLHVVLLLDVLNKKIMKGGTTCMVNFELPYI